eukprot:3431776-Pleurochrysis_carterae.AAC.1
MLEENDRRMEGKNAIDPERRAMRTKTIAAGDDVTSLRDELRQLREQMAAMTTCPPRRPCAPPPTPSPVT